MWRPHTRLVPYTKFLGISAVMTAGCATPETQTLPQPAPVIAPQNITIAVDKDGNIYWNDELVRDNDELCRKFKSLVPNNDMPCPNLIPSAADMGSR